MQDDPFAGEVVTIFPHPHATDVACMTANPAVIEALRHIPSAPPFNYAPSLKPPAYVISVRYIAAMVRGLKSRGVTVLDDYSGSEAATSTPGVRYFTRDGKREPYPPWCGQCEERTRQLEVHPEGHEGNHATVKRCPKCHPLAADEVPGYHAPAETGEELDREAYQAGVRRVREELDRIRGRHPVRTADDAPTSLGEMLARVSVNHPGTGPIIEAELIDEGDDEAHPF